MGSEMCIRDSFEGIGLIVSYKKGGKYIDFTQTVTGTQCSIHVDSENAQITRTIQIGNSEGLFNLKNGEVEIVWQMGGCMLDIISNEEPEEVIKFAESIQLLR